MDDEETGPSVKSIGRAATILKVLAALPSGGGLTEISREAGFGKATTHRILAALADVGFAYQNGTTRQYHLGTGLAKLSRQAQQRDVEILAEPVMLHLAQQTEDTVYVTIQEGLRSVCIGRQQGSFPIKTLTLDVGQSRPLGVGSGSLALLAFLPPGEIEAAIQANTRWLADFPSFGPDAVRAYVRETQERGYAFVKGYMTPGINAIGVPVFDAQHRPLAALSLTAIADRVTGDRALWLASLLREEAEQLSKLILARSQ
jgi:DNA-binding IclR family transcriptional regulator